MNPITDAVLNHINMQTNGALMITGDWGSGKTHYIKTQLFPYLKDKTQRTPIMVSVYGEKDKPGIAQRLVFTHWNGNEKAGVTTEKLLKGLTNLAAAVPALSKYVNVEKLLTGSGDNLLKLLPHDELLICFDDVERLSDKMDINDFLGLVNELVENTGAKVIIIANSKKFHKDETDEKAGKKLIFLEKTVEKIIYYVPDMAEVLANITSAYPKGDFQTFLHDQRSWLIETLSIAEGRAAEFQELKAELANIRTVKFALEHFRLAFEAVTGTKKASEPATLDQLKSLWLFALGISVAFRAAEVSADDQKHLDEGVPTLAGFDLDDLLQPAAPNQPQNVGAAPEAEPENPRAYAEAFRKKFYERLGQHYRYYAQLYRLITAGQAIDAAELNKDLDAQFFVHEGKVNPAQELLSKFVSGGYWNFKNEEFKPALKKLLAAGLAGEFEDVISYLNAGVFLLEFQALLEKTPEQIRAALQEGLGTRLAQISNNIFIRTQLEMVAGEFQAEPLQELVRFIRQRFHDKEKEEATEQAHQLEQSFINVPADFIKALMPANTHFRTPDQPLFADFSEETAQTGWHNWQPSDLTSLSGYFSIRYAAHGFLDRLVPELPFLRSFSAALQAYNDPAKALSVHVIQKHLLPRVQEAIRLLEPIVPPAAAEEPVNPEPPEANP